MSKKLQYIQSISKVLWDIRHANKSILIFIQFHKKKNYKKVNICNRQKGALIAKIQIKILKLTVFTLIYFVSALRVIWWFLIHFSEDCQIALSAHNLFKISYKLTIHSAQLKFLIEERFWNHNQFIYYKLYKLKIKALLNINEAFNLVNCMQNEHQRLTKNNKRLVSLN